MDPEPKKGPEKGECRSNIQGTVPAEILCKVGSQRWGQSACKISAHVHEPGNGTGIRFGQINSRRPVRRHTQEQYALAQREKDHRQIGI